MDFATAFDPHVRAALWSACAALAVTLVLLAAVLAMRVRLLRRLGREREVAARWIPLIARCTESGAVTLPPLSRRDADDFVLLWCRAQDSVRGQSQNHLREMARRMGADDHARRMFRSRSLRRRLVGTVALGHLRAQDLVPLLRSQIESAPTLPSLVAAKALIRMDASMGIPCRAVTRFSEVMYSVTNLASSVAKRRSRLVRMPTSVGPRVIGTPEM